MGLEVRGTPNRLLGDRVRAGGGGGKPPQVAVEGVDGITYMAGTTQGARVGAGAWS